MSSNREWGELYEKATSQVEEWRKEHRKATFVEIAREVDRELAKVRAQMIQDVAMASEAASSGAEVKCPECGRELPASGKHQRKLLTEHDEQVELTRSYARCPSCGRRFFPPG